MIALGIIAGHLLIGFLIGRRVFVNTLGDNERVIRHEYRMDKLTPEYTAALWWGILIIPGWPLIYPLRRVFGDTPHEKTVKRQAELNKLEDRMRALEGEFGLKFDSERLGK